MLLKRIESVPTEQKLDPGDAVTEPLEVMLGPTAVLIRWALVFGLSWLVAGGFLMVATEILMARRAVSGDSPYDYESEQPLGPDDDVLVVYDELILAGFSPAAESTYGEVAKRTGMPSERVRALLATPWVD